jgi:hypothetical protein
MAFEIVSEIRQIVTIASGRGVRIRGFLNKTYGEGRWRKRTGVATVKFADGSIYEAEIHWYEASGIGRKGFKIKRIIS